jgi:hypothetical protein
MPGSIEGFEEDNNLTRVHFKKVTEASVWSINSPRANEALKSIELKMERNCICKTL